jgi:hypothetical protein
MGDSISQLRQQLDELSHDMIELYYNMLKKSGTIGTHREAEAASYLTFLINRPYRRGIPNHSQNDLRGMVPLYEKYNSKLQTSDESIIFNKVRQRVGTLCAGLVTINLLYQYHSGNEYDVRFSHKTARDFFEDPSARVFLQLNDLTELDFFNIIFVASCECNCGSNHKRGVLEHNAKDIMNWCCDKTEDADKLKFLQSINKTMSQHYTKMDSCPTMNWNWVYG